MCKILYIKISKNIKTSKNEEQALCENYLYYKKRYNEKSKTTYWQCTVKGCNGTITTLADDTVQKVNGKKILNHDPMVIIQTHEHAQMMEDVVKLKEQMTNLNIRVLTEVDKPISQIFQEEQANFIKVLGGDVHKVTDIFPQWVSN